jgi:hypothetical protein
MKIKITLAFFLISQMIFGQDSIAVIRHYNNAKPSTNLDSIIYDLPKMIFVSLDNGFDDSLYITVNDIPVLNKYLITNPSIDQAAWFTIGFKDSTEVKVLKLKFIKANRYLEERVNFQYKSLIISGASPWQILLQSFLYPGIKWQ